MRTRTVTGEREQMVGTGAVWGVNDRTPVAVSYRLDVSDGGTVHGIITAAPFQRLRSRVAVPGEILLLRTACGHLISFDVRAYEPRPGGSAQIAGTVLPNSVAVTVAAAA